MGGWKGVQLVQLRRRPMLLQLPLPRWWTCHELFVLLLRGGGWLFRGSCPSLARGGCRKIVRWGV